MATMVLVTALGPRVPPQVGPLLAHPEQNFQAGASERNLLRLHQNCTNVQEAVELVNLFKKALQL